MKYRSGYKYQLAETYTVLIGICPDAWIETDFLRLEPDGTLTIRAGYAWDGPSGPAIDTRSAMRGSLVHDALYQLIRMELLPPSFRALADEEYRGLCLEDGMGKIRAWVQFTALRWFGVSSATPGKVKPVHVSP